MKTFKVALHLRRKIALLCALAFATAFLLLSIIASISVSDDLSQINALMRTIIQQLRRTVRLKIHIISTTQEYHSQ